MIPLHRKFNCSASLKSPEEFDHSFFSNYTGHWHDKHIREQMLDLNPSKIDKNGSTGFVLPTLYIHGQWLNTIWRNNYSAFVEMCLKIEKMINYE